jgi:hypothetical protein
MAMLGPRAVADPALPPRVFDAPTAWIQSRGAGHGTAGADHRGGGTILLTYGLAGLADLEIGAGDRVSTCDPCTGAERSSGPMTVLAAAIKVGRAQRSRWFPALALGFRRSVTASRAGALRDVDIAELFVVASLRRDAVTLHVGTAGWETSHVGQGGEPVGQKPRAIAIRPFTGVEWQPVRYPRTTVLGDLSFSPELGDAAAVRWHAAWGIRYQALAWGSIELAVRHGQDDGLAGSTVMVRVNGMLDRHEP